MNDKWYQSDLRWRYFKMYSSRTSVEILEVWDKISLLIHKNSVATTVIMRFTKCSQSWIVSKEAGIARHRRAKNSKLSIQSTAKLSAKRFYMLCCNCLITTEISISNPYTLIAFSRFRRLLESFRARRNTFWLADWVWVHLSALASRQTENSSLDLAVY